LGLNFVQVPLGSLFERSEVKDALALLSMLTDQRAMGLVRIACLPEFAMPMSDVVTVLDYLRQKDYHFQKIMRQ
jgi:hypothetical protein